MGWPHDISEPDLTPLRQALAACKVGADQIPDVVERLTRPPLSIGRSACDDPGPDATVYLGRSERSLPLSRLKRRRFAGAVLRFTPMGRAFDHDGAAWLLWFEEGCHDLPPTWRTLSRNARKRATTLLRWIGDNHGLSVTPQGRPPITDAALLLYCMRVLCEATGRREFPRLCMDGKPSGSMWRALSEALPLAQSFLARRYSGYGTHSIDRRVDRHKRDNPKINERTKSIAELIRVIRSKPFNDLCRTLRLGASAADVATSPAEFRLAIAYSRPRSLSRAA